MSEGNSRGWACRRPVPGIGGAEKIIRDYARRSPAEPPMDPGSIPGTSTVTRFVSIGPHCLLRRCGLRRSGGELHPLVAGRIGCAAHRQRAWCRCVVRWGRPLVLAGLCPVLVGCLPVRHPPTRPSPSPNYKRPRAARPPGCRGAPARLGPRAREVGLERDHQRFETLPFWALRPGRSWSAGGSTASGGRQRQTLDERGDVDGRDFLLDQVAELDKRQRAGLQRQGHP